MHRILSTRLRLEIPMLGKKGDSEGVVRRTYEKSMDVYCYRIQVENAI